MTWVRRNAQGKIEGAAEQHIAGFDEELPYDNPELRAFMDNTPLPEPVSVGHEALTERRARALDRKGTIEARVEAINLRMGV